MKAKCPCCNDLMVAGRSQHQELYRPLLCQACDYVNYVGEKKIEHSDYEMSDQYKSYHDGKPKLLWQHEKCLAFLHQFSRLDDLSLLDFGCFDGFFVGHLRALGFEARGVDWNLQAIKHGSENYGLHGYLEDSLTGTFDVVCALEVIEHFEKPQDFFDLVNKHLKEGGYLVLSCPSSWSAYRPLTDFPPHHFSRFNPANLKLLLERQGYQLTEQHEQMSITQLFRNWAGDLFRASSRANNVSSSLDAEFSTSARVLRRFFNLCSGIFNVAAAPFDWLLFKLGFRYLGQIAIAKKVS